MVAEEDLGMPVRAVRGPQAKMLDGVRGAARGTLALTAGWCLARL